MSLFHQNNGSWPRYPWPQGKDGHLVINKNTVMTSAQISKDWNTITVLPYVTLTINGDGEIPTIGCLYDFIINGSIKYNNNIHSNGGTWFVNTPNKKLLTYKIIQNLGGSGGDEHLQNVQGGLGTNGYGGGGAGGTCALNPNYGWCNGGYGGSNNGNGSTNTVQGGRPGGSGDVTQGTGGNGGNGTYSSYYTPPSGDTPGYWTYVGTGGNGGSGGGSGGGGGGQVNGGGGCVATGGGGGGGMKGAHGGGLYIKALNILGSGSISVAGDNGFVGGHGGNSIMAGTGGSTGGGGGGGGAGGSGGSLWIDYGGIISNLMIFSAAAGVGGSGGAAGTNAPGDGNPPSNAGGQGIAGNIGNLLITRI